MKRTLFNASLIYKSMPKKFEIVLRSATNPAGVYSPGEELSGAVVVQSNKPKRYRAIRVSLLGRSEVCRRQGLFISSETFRSFVDFLSLTTTTWEPGSNGVILRPGRHEFPFRFLLPLAIPSSFNEALGSVSYMLTATIEKGRFSFDHFVEKSFRLMSVPNLIFDNHLFRPVCKEDRRVGGLFTSGSLTVVSAYLPKRVFSVGDYLPLNVSVILARARRESFRLTAELVKRVFFMTEVVAVKYDTTLSSVTVSGRYLPTSNTAQRMLWSPNGLKVPVKTVPTTDAECELINISYYVRVSLASWWRLHVSTSIPVVICLPGDMCATFTLPPIYSEAMPSKYKYIWL